MNTPKGWYNTVLEINKELELRKHSNSSHPLDLHLLTIDVGEIKRMLLEKSNELPTEADRWFDLNELINYLPEKPAKTTVYGWVSDGLIPCHKGGKKLRFLKSEIDNYLKQGSKKTFAEVEAEAQEYLHKKKRG